MTAARLTRVLFCVLAASFFSQAQAETATLKSEFKVIKTMNIGGEGRWDYITIDAQSKRLYVPRSDYVLILNAEDGSVVGKVAAGKSLHGVALVEELNRGFVSSGADGVVTVFDLKTLEILGKIKAGIKPDAIIYDPATRQVFAFNNRGESVTVIDAAVDLGKDVTAKSLELGGAPEYAVADGKGHVYVNLEDKNEVLQIDAKELKVTARWSLAPGNEPTGLSMDIEHHRLFAGCHNKNMVILDSDSGKILATLPIGQGVDATAFDPQLGLAFASNRDGTLNIIREISPDQFVSEQTVKTIEGARTMALDVKNHRLFLPTIEGKNGPFVIVVVGIGQ